MAAPDLELVDTKDLLTELCRRFDGVVFCGIHDETPDEWASQTKLEGNAIACLAAAALLQARVVERVAAEDAKR